MDLSFVQMVMIFYIKHGSDVIAWLHQLSFVSDLFEHYVLDNAYEIWSDRKDRFSLGDSARLYQLRQQLMTLNQGNSDVRSYFTSLRSVWDEFKNSQPISWCTCNRCTCNSAARWHQHQENDCRVQFLIGLNSFSQIRSNILAISPLPSLSKVFSLVIQEERQRRIDGKLVSSAHSPAQAPVMSEQPFSNAASSYGRGYNKFLCSHCGKTNHNADKCFFLHGFPPGYGRDKPKPAGFAQSSSFKPSGSAQSGSYKHKSINCVEDNSDSSHWKGAQTIANLPSMDQYQQLVNLLQSQFHTQSSLTTPESAQSPQPLTQSQPTQSYNPFSGTICFSPSVNALSSSCSSLSTWILDTGATHHVCYDPSLLSSASSISMPL